MVEVTLELAEQRTFVIKTFYETNSLQEAKIASKLIV